MNCIGPLKQTVNSVIAQNFEGVDMEYIIVDGGSDDGTVTFLKDLSDEYSFIKYTSEKDTGIYDAMNKGLRFAKGKIVNFLNAGDSYCRNDVIKEVWLNYTLGYTLIYGDIYVSYGSKQSLVSGSNSPYRDIHKGMCICHQSMFVARDIYPVHADLRFKAEWLALKTIIFKGKAKLIKLKNPVVLYQLGGFGEIHWKDNLIEFKKVYKKEFGVMRYFFNYHNFLRVYLKMSAKSVRRAIFAKS